MGDVKLDTRHLLHRNRCMLQSAEDFTDVQINFLNDFEIDF